jgi:methyl-accepting chemotaxis protein
MNIFQGIKFKIWICVGVVALGFLVATIVTFNANNQLDGDLSNLRDADFPLTLRGTEVQNIYSKQLNLYEDAFLLADEDALTTANILGGTISNLLDEMVKVSADGGKEGSKFHAELIDFRKSYNSYRTLAAKYYGMLTEGEDVTTIQDEVQMVGQMQQGLTASLYELNQSHIAAVEDEIAASKDLAKSTSNLIILLFAIVMVLSAVIANLAASRLLIKPIRAVQELAGRLANGEIDAARKTDIKAEGEVGDLVKAIVDMADNLRDMVLKVNSSSDAMAQVSENLSQTATRVDLSAHGQVEEVDKTSAAVNKINTSVGEVARSMENITATSEDVTTSILEQVASTEEIAQNVDNLSEAADNVNSSIVEIAANIKQVSESVGGLKEEADVTASSVAEMESSIKQVEQGANDTAQITTSVRQDAEEGQKAVQEAIAGMSRIKESSSQASTAIKSFSEKAQNIGEILKVIDNLTDETNLLALNAAIIAAQAGEHGRGFAVVADQIKELADQTSLSTKEIVTIIQGVQSESQNAVTAIVEAEKSIVDGESLSLQSGEALAKIVSGSQQVANEMDKISSATREQVKGGEMISVAMERVSDMVNQIVTAIREQESGSKLIITVSEKMRELTNKINTSTKEQSGASRNVAAGMEEVNSMIQKVNMACEEQRVESQQIVEAVSGIKKSAQTNLDATSIVSDASKELKVQTDLLLDGIGKFKVGNGRQSSKIIPIQKASDKIAEEAIPVSEVDVENDDLATRSDTEQS